MTEAFVQGSPGSGRARRRAARLVTLAAAVAVGMVVSACTSNSTSGNPNAQSPVSHTSAQQSSTPAPSTSSPAADAVITTSLTARSNLSPVTPVTVSVKSGQLSSVTLLNPEGKPVAGALSDDKTSWHNTEPLGYGRSYQLSAAAVGDSGKPATSKTTFSTLTPPNMTMPYINTIGGQAMENGAKYGVGIVPVVHFDEPITDKKAAERALVVTTTPATAGSWHWVSDTDVHWRSYNFLKSGTHVRVDAKVYGVQVSPGLYGQSDASVSFTIGPKHVSYADDKTHMVTVYFNDKVVRTMPTSMGQGGYVQGTGGQQISLWTMNGTYTVIGHENPAIMSSASYGLPANSPKGYAPEKIYLATKISTDGIYLHQLTTTIWAQGHTDVSHGCLNLNTDNANFYFTTSQIGDVVEIRNTGGPTITVAQGGDWSVPWAQWVAGSALH